MLRKIEGRRRRRRQDEVVGWHVQLNGHEFEQTQEDSEGRRSLTCCSPWGYKASDMTVTKQQYVCVCVCVCVCVHAWASLVAQLVKSLPAM